MSGRESVRNRGYRFILRDLGFQQGYCALCINATWINQLLYEAGIDLREFRKLTWEGLYAVQNSDRAKSVLEEMRPKNFWQMCDAFTVLNAKYETRGRVYKERWFRRYPVLVIEDIYELLLEEGFSNKEALEIAEFYEMQQGDPDRTELRDFLELYDVPDGLSEAIMSCRSIPKRELMIRETLRQIAKAVNRSSVRAKESIEE